VNPKHRGWGLKSVSSRHTDALSQIGHAEFERLFADHYREQGYAVDHCGAAVSGMRFDGGIDLKLRKGDEFVLVQCKHWNAKQVPHNAIHELLGIMVNEGATEAIVITSGEFTQAARLAGNKQGHVQLIDGVEVRRLLGERLDLLVKARPASTNWSAENQVEPWSPVQHQSEWREPRRRRKKDRSLDDVTIKVAVTLAFIIFALLVIPSMFARVLRSLAPQPVVVQPIAVPEPVRETPDTPRLSGAPVDLAPQQPEPPPTAQELAAARAEQARRDAETQRYLETVPEVTHYSYSPLDQNKDPEPPRSN